MVFRTTLHGVVDLMGAGLATMMGNLQVVLVLVLVLVLVGITLATEAAGRLAAGGTGRLAAAAGLGGR